MFTGTTEYLYSGIKHKAIKVHNQMRKQKTIVGCAGSFATELFPYFVCSSRTFSLQ